jgi:hypothetical protein
VVEFFHIEHNSKNWIVWALIDANWSSVELYNRYRQFYESDIAGVLAYVVEVVPDHLLAQLDLLLEVAADVNKGNRS